MKKQTKEFLEILMLTQEELYNYIIDILTIRDIKYKAKDEAYIYINDHAWNVTRPLLTSHLDTIDRGKFVSGYSNWDNKKWDITTSKWVIIDPEKEKNVPKVDDGSITHVFDGDFIK